MPEYDDDDFHDFALYDYGDGYLILYRDAQQFSRMRCNA